MPKERGMGTRESSKKGVGFHVQCNYCDKQFWIGSGHRVDVQSKSRVNTGVYKLIKRLSACMFVSRSKKYRTRSESKFGLKRTERSERSLEPCNFLLVIISNY